MSQPLVIVYLPGLEDLRVTMTLFIAAQETFARYGMQVTIHFEHDDVDSVLRLAETTGARVVLAIFGIPQEVHQKLVEAGVLVITPGQGEDDDLWSYVDVARQVGKAQVSQCFEYGYQSLLYLGWATYELPTIQAARLDGARQECRDRGQEFLPYYELPDDQDGQMEVVARALHENPETDAICAFRDIQAAQAMTVLKAMGRAIPTNIGIIGYGDYQLCKLVRPLLSSLVLNPHVITEALALTVLSRLKNDSGLLIFPMSITSPVIRQSLRTLS